MATKSWFVQKLIEMGACSDAIRYAKKHRTFPAAWQDCKNTTWLNWLVRQVDLIPAHTGAMSRCSGCKWDREHHKMTPSAIKRRFTAERVSKALREWTA